jgi:hypothetical protein
MPPTIQVGTVLISDSPLMTRIFGLESEAYSGTWSVVKLLDGFALDPRIRAAGWNFFFMAAEAKIMFLGSPEPKKLERALKRILGKMVKRHFNAIEVTGIITKHFMRVPYSTLTAHSRHIQQGYSLNNSEGRHTFHPHVEWVPIRAMEL